MNTNDLLDWKRHPVTQVIFSQLSVRVQYILEILGEQAGKDPYQDRELVGAIKAYRDILGIELDKEETPE